MGIWMICAFLFCAIMTCAAKTQDDQSFYLFFALLNALGMIVYILRPPGMTKRPEKMLAQKNTALAQRLIAGDFSSIPERLQSSEMKEKSIAWAWSWLNDSEKNREKRAKKALREIIERNLSLDDF